MSDLDDFFSPQSGAANEANHKLEPLIDSLQSQVLVIKANTVEVKVKQEDANTRLRIGAVLENTLDDPVDLNVLTLLLRDGQGNILDSLVHGQSGKFNHSQEILLESWVMPGIAAELSSVEVIADYRFEFRTRLVKGTCESIGDIANLPHRKVLALTLEHISTPPGYPTFEADIHSFVGYQYSPFCEVLITLTQKCVSEDSNREVVAILRNGVGEVIDKSSNWVSLLQNCPVTRKFAFNVDRHKIRSIREIDIAIKGTCAVKEPLGIFIMRTDT